MRKLEGDGIPACTRLHTQRFEAWKCDGHVDIKITNFGCLCLMALDPQSTVALTRACTQPIYGTLGEVTSENCRNNVR